MNSQGVVEKKFLYLKSRRTFAENVHDAEYEISRIYLETWIARTHTLVPVRENSSRAGGENLRFPTTN